MSNTISFTLTKTKEYKLKPFGKFRFVWKRKTKIYHILVDEIEQHFDDRMPLNSPEVENEITKYMKKNKTDVLVDDYHNYYTRTSNGFIRITHQQLSDYEHNRGGYRDAVDGLFE